MRIDIPAFLVILADLMVSTFLLWRVFTKKATLWGAARFIYAWVAFLSAYHAGIYMYSLFQLQESESSIVYTWLHPFVVFFVISPVLIAIIHWRGGKI